MKKLFLTLIIITCAVCFLVFQIRKHDAKFLSNEMLNQKDNWQINEGKALSKTAKAVDASKFRKESTNVLLVESGDGKTNQMNAGLLSHWQGEINFYGKIVDENSNAIAGAQIKFSWNFLPTENGMRSADVESDSSGMFYLKGQRGLNLTVWVNKDGYYTSKSDNNSFTYGSLGGAKFTPNPLNPIVFHLRKKGNKEALAVLKRNYPIPRDGSPLSVDLTTGAAKNSEAGDFVVQCWTNDKGIKRGQKYDWRCVISVPGGGLLTTDSEFPFQAPESGYVPSIEIAMPADSANWKSQVDLQFFYKLADGRYGRMTFSMIAGGQHFCMISSVLNPSGSTHLE